MTTKICAGLVLILLLATPVAIADPSPSSAGEDVSAQPVAQWCVDVNAQNTPPVDVYECSG